MQELHLLLEVRLQNKGRASCVTSMLHSTPGWYLAPAEIARTSPLEFHVDEHDRNLKQGFSFRGSGDPALRGRRDRD